MLFEGNTVALNYAFAGLGIALLLVAAVSDARRYIIPNWISLALLVLGFAWGLMLYPNFDWLAHLGWALAVFAIGFGLFVARLLGGGDVKLLAVLSFWAGPTLLVSFLTITVLVGGVLSFFILALAWWGARQKRNTQQPSQSSKAGLLERLWAQALVAQAASATNVSDNSAKETHTGKLLSVKVPYGIAIAAAGVYLFVRITGHLE